MYQACYKLTIFNKLPCFNDCSNITCLQGLPLGGCVYLNGPGLFIINSNGDYFPNLSRNSTRHRVKKRKVSIRANGNLSKPIITCRHAHSGLNYELPISELFFTYAN